MMEKSDQGWTQLTVAARGLAALPCFASVGRALRARRAAAALVVAAAVFASAASGETYTWDSANPATSLGGGAVTATLDGFSVSALSKNAEGNVRIEGDSMAFAAGAEISQPLGSLTFALPLMTAGALGEGSSLSIGEGGLTFVDDAGLDVTGPEVKDMHRTGLRVGTTACLSDQTLLKIKYNDFAVRQDSEGYILAASHGTMILFK